MTCKIPGTYSKIIVVITIIVNNKNYNSHSHGNFLPIYFSDFWQGGREVLLSVTEGIFLFQ